MYNLNVNVNPSPMAAAGLLGVAAAEVTPRTPEIVNSLIAMTNPFDGYSNDRSRDRTDSMSSGEPSPPSVQHTCSQLIKEGLKLTLQTKRRVNGSSDEATKKSRKEDNSADDEEEDGDSSNNNSRVGLTPEDEERRRRRRERNKIAATKCRLKKREKTVILVQESEILETQNHDLKSEIKKLETQRRRLVDMLSHHGPTCIKQQNAGTNDYHQSYNEPLPSYEENFGPATSIITTATTTTTNSSSLSSLSSSSSTSSTSSISSSRSTNSQPPIALNQPQNCVTDYPVKLEVYDATQDFYHRQDNSPYVPTTDSGCAV